jgi:hypothetical protein
MIIDLIRIPCSLCDLAVILVQNTIARPQEY